MDNYQIYWWGVVSLLGAILVFLLFVQGGNSQLFCIGKTAEQRHKLLHATGKKWELTFTTLVTFGGAFFAAFPLFYSTSFGGAYWLWMIILFTFVLQAVSYEFGDKLGNMLGERTYQTFLVINGVIGPLLLGGAVATFFNGSAFLVDKANITDFSSPAISSWANGWHGLDALLDLWNVCLGLAVFNLARCLGALYFINTIDDTCIAKESRKQLMGSTVFFLVFFLAFLIRTLLKDGYAVNIETAEIYMQPYKYFNNLLEYPIILAGFLAGVLSVLWGLGKTILQDRYKKGVWWVGAGTVVTVWTLLLTLGNATTAYYPSNVDLQSSLTIANSSSSLFTLQVMTYVSFLVPIVLAYIIYVWRKLR